MDGTEAYTAKDGALVLNATGNSTSMYMTSFWGHDENLMYYRNHVFPLMSGGWGSTADYVLLSDNDTIDLAMFSNWDFWTYGAFAAFDKDEYRHAKQKGYDVSKSASLFSFSDADKVSGYASEAMQRVASAPARQNTPSCVSVMRSRKTSICTPSPINFTCRKTPVNSAYSRCAPS